MNNRKILILSDLEGILGVDSIFNTKSNVSKYQREVSAYLQVASKLGYEVFYCDMHGNGTWWDGMIKKVLLELSLKKN